MHKNSDIYHVLRLLTKGGDWIWKWYARATPAEEKTGQYHWERKDQDVVQAEIKARLQQQAAISRSSWQSYRV